MLSAEVQKRIDVDVIELEFGDRSLGRFAIGSFDDRVVKRTALCRLEILARRKTAGAEFARVKIVEDEAQRFQFVAQNVDWFQ